MTKAATQAEYAIYSPELEHKAADVLRAAEARRLRIATAESCTGGALAALLTDVEGLGHVFDRGFAVYCEEAKTECLGVPAALIKQHGAVSAPVARAMAQGGLDRSGADLAVAITGNAGPAGPHDEEGLVFVCVAARDGRSRAAEYHFGPAGRSLVRMRSIAGALDLLARAMDEP